MHPVNRSQIALSIGLALGWERLSLALAIIAASTYLAVEGLVDPAAPIGIFTAILGYVFGASSPQAVDAAKESGSE